jgi:hypothetical protein
MNELDRTIKAMQRSNAGAPEFYRQLVAAELWFLLPYHPEMEGAHMQIQNGSPFPFCVQTESDGEEIVPIFSSEARLEESLRAGDVPTNKFLCGKMPGVQVLELIGKVGFAAVLNRGCATGELALPADLLCDLADGSIFEPTGPSEIIQAAVTLVNPADYPTDLIQRAFEFIRQYRAFRAAWVFLLPDDSAAFNEARTYQLLFLVSPRSQALLHDLNLALNCSPPKGVTFNIGTVDETDTVQIVTLFAKAQPFYLAQDFVQPKG